MVLGARDRAARGGRSHGRDARPAGRRRRRDAGRGRHAREPVPSGSAACSRAVPERAILVGYSMGGVVVTQAADELPRARRTRSSSSRAFMPANGQSLLDLTHLPEGAGDLIQANIVIEGDPPVAVLSDEATAAAVYNDCTIGAGRVGGRQAVDRSRSRRSRPRSRSTTRSSRRFRALRAHDRETRR